MNVTIVSINILVEVLASARKHKHIKTVIKETKLKKNKIKKETKFSLFTSDP